MFYNVLTLIEAGYNGIFCTLYLQNDFVFLLLIYYLSSEKYTHIQQESGTFGTCTVNTLRMYMVVIELMITPSF